MSSKIGYKNFMEELRGRINRELESFFARKIYDCEDEKIRNVITELKNFTMNGGKRIRPIMMIIGYGLFNNIDDKIIKASISIELAQSYLLIHDDIMDNSDMRRGMPSFHKSMESKIGKEDGAKIAENIAISAGDLIDTYSHEALLSSGFDLKNLINADSEFSKIIEDTGKGQILDIYSSIDEEYSEKNLLKLHYLKTARYTIQGPMLMGAYLAGNTNYIENIKTFGRCAGIAFQLYDDVLGLFGNEKNTGKPIKGDVNDGKKTLLIIHAYENSDKINREFIDRCLRSGNVSDTDFEKIREIVNETGSYNYSKDKINEYNKSASEELNKINGNPEILNLLNYLLNYLTNREN